MKFLKISLAIVILLAIVYLLGPSPSIPEYPKKKIAIPDSSIGLQNYILAKEASHRIKPDNKARIVWFNDSLKNKTEYSVVYLHGFGASQKEGDPAHTLFAKTFGANLFLSRLAEHGLDTTDPMVNLTADKYWESAKEALEIGKKLGQKVIIIGTSTGATNALQLAAAYPEDVHALFLLSPNIEINDPNAWVLNNHWGLQVARLIKQDKFYTSSDTREVYKKYWYSRYRLEGVVALQEMLETTMTEETFRKVTQPVLMLYYYKDEDHQDPVVRVSAMLEMFGKLGTAPEKKHSVAIPEAGDHVIISPIKSKDPKKVIDEMLHFATGTLNMLPVETK